MKTNYNGHSRKSGIYQIRNLNNGKAYIGSTFCFKIRYKQHLSSLNKGTHHNKHLQAAFIQDGSNAFVFEILEVVEGEQADRLLVEQVHLDKHQESWEHCYNFKQQTIASSRSCYSNNPEETSRLISENSKKMWSSRTESEKQKIVNIMQSNRTEETFLKISKANKGRKLKPEHLDKVRTASLGHKHTEEFKKARREYKHTEDAIKKISAASLGRKRSKESLEKQSGNNHWSVKKSFTKDTICKMRKSANKRATKIKATKLSSMEEIFFDSIHEAARTLSIHKPNISNVLKGKQKQAKGYLFEVVVNFE